ncbi:MAG: hypothetical protein IPN22_02065 [Bacteroidetes bacterium]|nr:hypothetical protein [Bacteroidota bacterium]
MSLLILAACNNKQGQNDAMETIPEGKVAFSDTASSSVKVFDNNGRVCIQQTNTYYELVDAYEGSTRIPLLLKITRTDLCFADSVNKDKVYQISAKSVMDTKEIKWDVQLVATDINLKDNSNTLLAVHEGAGEEEDLISRFSLLTGKEVFNCSYGDLRVSIPNVKDKRFLGYVSRNAVGNPIKEKGQENLIGIINYSTSRNAVSSAKILLKRSGLSSAIPAYTPEMTLVPENANVSIIEDGKMAILMKADEKYKPSDINDFALKLTYYYGTDNEYTDIIIPVENDQLQVTKAQYDSDIFTIQ